MASRRIRYAQSPDAARIAWTVEGNGPALLYFGPIPFCHLELDDSVTLFRDYYPDLATHFQLVRFDPRGVGLSDRDPSDISLETLATDVEAVVAASGIESFLVMAYGTGCTAAMAFAARHPERVRRLALWEDVGLAGTRTPQLDAVASLIAGDWETFTNTLAYVGMGWANPADAAAFANLARHATTQLTAVQYFGAFSSMDVSGTAAAIQSPTLVFHRRGARVADLAHSRRLASEIPDAHLVVAEGDTWGPRDHDPIVEFLLEGEETPETEAEESVAIPFRTILFTDLQGHTEMMARLGDLKGREALREHERITRQCLRAHSGAEIKTMGDGFMASFGSAQKALECATALQQAVTESAVLSPHTSVRVGVNAGEPIAEEDDLFGASVIVAARVAAKAAGAQIYVSDVVRQLVAGKGFLFADTGEHVLKGFEDPVRIWELRW